MGSLGLHALLLNDAVRTRAFDRALAKRIRRGDVVADLGAGSGILSLLALKRGAARVYAVERHPVAELIRVLARENGVEDRLVVVRGNIEEVRLPERVDVVVSEMLGHAVFDENLLGLMHHARRRFLRRGGSLIPSRVEVVAAPASCPEMREWKYGVRLEALRSMTRQTYWVPDRMRLRGAARTLGAVRPGHDRHPVSFSGRWPAARADGLALWFAADLAPGVRLSSRRGTHWKPVFFPAPEPLRGKIAARLTFQGPDEATWQFDGLPAQHTALGDEKTLAQRSIREADVPRLARSRRDAVSLLARVDGRRTVADLARSLKGMAWKAAVAKVQSVCLEEDLLW